MTAFIQGTRSVGISGGNFRQESYSEQHEHNTRVFQDDRTVIQGNIYGYTHTATSDDGPIIAYSHTTNITPRHDQISSQPYRGIPRGGHARPLPSSDTPLLVNGTNHPTNRRDLTSDRRPGLLLSQTQHHTAEPFSVPGLSQELNAEFRTMSPEMQRYVGYMLAQLEKRRTTSCDSGQNMKYTPPARGAGLKPRSSIQSHPGPALRQPYQTARSVSSNFVTPSPPMDSHFSGRVEAQPLSDAPENPASNKTQHYSQKQLEHNPTDIAPNHPSETKGLMKALVRKTRGISKIFRRPGAKSVG